MNAAPGPRSFLGSSAAVAVAGGQYGVRPGGRDNNNGQADLAEEQQE